MANLRIPELAPIGILRFSFSFGLPDGKYQQALVRIAGGHGRAAAAALHHGAAAVQP
jgi:hypothetical protein